MCLEHVAVLCEQYLRGDTESEYTTEVLSLVLMFYKFLPSKFHHVCLCFMFPIIFAWKRWYYMYQHNTRNKSNNWTCHVSRVKNTTSLYTPRQIMNYVCRGTRLVGWWRDQPIGQRTKCTWKTKPWQWWWNGKLLMWQYCINLLFIKVLSFNYCSINTFCINAKLTLSLLYNLTYKLLIHWSTFQAH